MKKAFTRLWYLQLSSADMRKRTCSFFQKPRDPVIDNLLEMVDEASSP